MFQSKNISGTLLVFSHVLGHCCRFAGLDKANSLREDKKEHQLGPIHVVQRAKAPSWFLPTLLFYTWLSGEWHSMCWAYMPSLADLVSKVIRLSHHFQETKTFLKKEKRKCSKYRAHLAAPLNVFLCSFEKDFDRLEPLNPNATFSIPINIA